MSHGRRLRVARTSHAFLNNEQCSSEKPQDKGKHLQRQGTGGNPGSKLMERREVSLLIRAAFRKENYSLLGESWEGRKGLPLSSLPADHLSSPCICICIHPAIFILCAKYRIQGLNMLRIHSLTSFFPSFPLFVPAFSLSPRSSYTVL